MLLTGLPYVLSFLDMFGHSRASMRKKVKDGEGYFLRRVTRNGARSHVDIPLEHRFRTPCRLAGRGSRHRHGNGPLGNARMDHLDPRLGYSCLFTTASRFHHAGNSLNFVIAKVAFSFELPYHNEPVLTKLSANRSMLRTLSSNFSSLRLN